MKYLKLLVLFITMSISFSTFVYGSSNDEIRVGLEKYFKGIKEFSINNDVIIFGYDKGGDFSEGGTLIASDKFNFNSYTSDFFRLDEKFYAYKDANNLANDYKNLGFEASVSYSDNGEFYAIILDNYENLPENSETRNGDIISGSYGRLGIYDGLELDLVFLDKSANIKGENNEILNLGDGYKSYRGRIEPVFTGQIFTLVNILTIDEYLYGVVPSEMPSQWNIEALKAQSISARTYVISNLGKHEEDGYDVCDGTHCQVYLGVENEAESTNKAIDETSGLAIYYDDYLIDAVFSSSSGGVTANSEDVWTYKIPYLREVLDVYDTEGKVWEKTMTLEDIATICNNAGENVGEVTGIRIDELSENGRVNKLTIIGTRKDLTLEKEAVRTFFTPSLDSRFFTISSDEEIIKPGNDNSSYEVYIYGRDEYVEDMTDLYIYNENKEVSGNYSFNVKGNDVTVVYGKTTSIGEVTESTGDVITFSGKGWGHGVGMSQYGAKGMATAGYDYEEILKFYYSGIEIK